MTDEVVDHVLDEAFVLRELRHISEGALYPRQVYFRVAANECVERGWAMRMSSIVTRKFEPFRDEDDQYMITDEGKKVLEEYKGTLTEQATAKDVRDVSRGLAEAEDKRFLDELNSREDPSCKLCAHFDQSEFVTAKTIARLCLAPEQHPGFCHRYPPVPTGEAYRASFPGVLSTQCCGEFRRKP